jgi:hypothetical protein
MKDDKIPVIDLSGMIAFWMILEILQSDNEPSEHQWKQLFNTLGYKALSTEFDSCFFRKKYELAYKPSSRAIKGHEKDDRYVKHYLEVAEKRKEVEAWLRDIEENDFLKGSLSKVKEWLPSDVDEAPVVAFVVFEMDARGYDCIVLDPLFSMSLGSDIGDLLAHELFHNYARKFYVYDPCSAEPLDVDLLWVLRQLNEEGIADQIFALRYPSLEEQVENSPIIIQEMDKIIQKMAFSKDTRELSKRLRMTLPRAGHLTGYYMAKAILKGLGKERLLETVGNPFGFIGVYDEAAEILGLRCFSPETLEYIESLLGKYTR